jgi:tRNA threonylcarbamoyl adenosine modification protein YeaZ
MPLVLATDTSTDVCTVALCRDGVTLAEAMDSEDRRHAERLLPLAQDVLRQAGAAMHDVDVFAVSRGPGSFTGLRIGASAWKGLAFAMQKPLVAVPTLDALALVPQIPDGVVCVALDARMKEVFGAVYDFQDGTRTKRADDRVCSMEAFIEALEGAVYFIGDGALRYADEVHARLPHATIAPLEKAAPRAWAVAREALALLAAGANTDAALVEPVYLRASQAEVMAARKAAANA